MSVLILGGDKVDTIGSIIQEFGIEQIVHWTARNLKRGRKKNRPLPSHIRLLVMLTSFLNHNAMKHYRSEAKSKKIPVVYIKSASCLKEELTRAVAAFDPDSPICRACEHYVNCERKE